MTRLVLLIGLLVGLPFGSTPSSWEKVDGGSGTGCATGTPYAFFVHRGAPDRLAIFLQGGGACWSAATCDVNGRPSYDPTVDTRDDPTNAPGILDLEREDNPIKGYTVVFVPYCTGDVHLGDQDVTYDGGLMIHHGGRANVEAGLAWAQANVPRPEIVFVMGASAGSLPSPVYAAEMARAYPAARIVQLGDAAGAYRGGRTLWVWGAVQALKRDPLFKALGDSAGYLDLYSAAAAASPRIRFSQINSADDGVQLRFLQLSGDLEAKVSRELASNMPEIQRRIPGFRSFTWPGAQHTILTRPAFYSTTVDGVLLRDWVAALLAGKDVADVGRTLFSQ